MKLQRAVKRVAAVLRPQPVRAEMPFNTSKQDRWRGRAEAAVQLWFDHGKQIEGVSVADLGAGNELVGRLIDERALNHVRYQAYDLHPQQPSTLPLDVRRGLPESTVDVTFALGLIEYLATDDQILERLAAYSEDVILSYCHFDDSRKTHAGRVELGWKRHQTSKELDEALERVGFREVARAPIDNGDTQIRLLTRAGPPLATAPSRRRSP